MTDNVSPLASLAKSAQLSNEIIITIFHTEGILNILINARSKNIPGKDFLSSINLINMVSRGKKIIFPDNLFESILPKIISKNIKPAIPAKNMYQFCKNTTHSIHNI